MTKLKLTIDSPKQVIILSIILLAATVLVFSLGFKNLSFKHSSPNDWSIFTTYFSNIIVPILTLINLVIFIKLTKSIQRASENKSWVERTEKLTFDLIDSVSKEASVITTFTVQLIKMDIAGQIDFIKQSKISDQISVLNNDVSERQFKLRLYLESEIFKNCKHREKFLTSTTMLIPKINSFIAVFALEKPDKSIELKSAFKEIENSIKTTIETGKKFCDEIYHIGQ